MKNNIFKLLVLTLLVVISQTGYSKVAKPGKISYRQPDGSIVYIEKHGDEFCHWITSNGVTVKIGADGFLIQETPAQTIMRKTAGTDATLKRNSRPAISRLPEGSDHYLVLLVEFSDLSFTTPDANTAFSNLLNQSGYAANGATGSVHDYFSDNSNGKFNPVFDVYGPIKLTKSYSYYGKNDSYGNDEHPDQALYEACKALDSEIDFSIYDHDNDGYVDNVYYFFAGESEAESYAEDIIWPHAWALYNYYLKCDGVRVYSYACGSELKGSGENTSMDGIGTFCHEFGHVIGLPDLYDTDYEDNGEALTPGWYSLMDMGCYCNDSNTPPYLNCIERNTLGWAPEPEKWTESGEKSIPGIENDVAYYTPTSKDGEWFIYETRSGQGWDKYVDPGLLIYHMDKSSRYVHGISAINRWENWNGINCYSDHPCFYPVEASANIITFGAGSGVTAFNGVTNPATIDWDGIDTGYYLDNISFKDGVTTLNLDIIQGYCITGYVKDSKGNPISDVTMSINPVSSSSSTDRGFKKLSLPSASHIAKYNVKTDETGYFIIKADSEDGTGFLVVANKDGYVRQAATVTMTQKSEQVNFILKEVFNSSDNLLAKHGPYESAYGFTDSQESYDYMVSAGFSIQELKSNVGSKLESISFMIDAEEVAECYVIIDFGTNRVLTQKVENPQLGTMCSVDISNSNLTIPSGKDIHIGYAVKGVKGDYPICVGSYVGDGGFCFAEFDLKSSDWTEYELEGLMVEASLQYETKPLTYFGFNMIQNDLKSFTDGTKFPLKIVSGDSSVIESVTWYYDDTLAKSSSVYLKKGKHTVKAVLSYYDGTSETLELVLEVE